MKSLALSASFTLFLCAPAFSVGVDPGEFGVLYNCGFPVTIALDGNLGDWPANVPWHKVTHDVGWNIPEDDDDGSYEFGCVAEGAYKDTSVWGDLRFVETSFAVSQRIMLATTWASTKARW
jgi:hypothetical protein